MFQVEFSLKNGALSAHVLVSPSARASLIKAERKAEGGKQEEFNPFDGNPLPNGSYAFTFTHKETADAVKNDIALYFGFYYESPDEGKKHVKLIELKEPAKEIFTVGQVKASEGAPEISLEGEPITAASVNIICKKDAEVFITLNGSADGKTVSLPEDRKVVLEEIGLTLVFPEGIKEGQSWSFAVVKK